MERALRSLLALDDPDRELVLVGDRSDDGTGEIADRLGAGDDRPRVIRLGGLSAGWFGKNHASWRGACEARGKLLVFADGEVVFACEAAAPGVRRHLSVTRPESCAGYSNRDRTSTTARARCARRA